MLIFDQFPDRQKADDFAQRVQTVYPHRTAYVYDSADEANKVDLYPFSLKAPVVHVSRTYKFDSDDIAEETAIEELVLEYGGNWAGT